MADLQHPRPLDPQVADLVARVKRANRPPYWQYTPQDARAFHEKASKVLEIAPAPVAQVRDLSIPVGDAHIGARLYTGMQAREPAPLVIFAHGGGFTIGSVESYDAICRMLANGACCKVLSLDYRLAPEYRFPTAAEDVYAAWRWAFDEHTTIGIDPQRVAGMGDSAGGTLTAQAALRARDDRLPLAAQVLLYPGTSAWQDTQSHRAYAEGYLLDAKTIQWFFNHYLRDDADRMDWRFAPLDAPEFAGLAPVFLQLAECDPLVDEGLAYGRKLEDARVRVDLKVYEGAIHSFYNMGGALRVARQAHRDTVDYLRSVFGTSKAT
ncbi:MAG: alpha/beta hydrolase [Pigmentiphaga sp.]|uniref:alpha/beta hydrolase n=1 Tax=Pigmentiphaga sp. TaxID=1977564 RepID=UPI0029A93971|nr:alpha/beta hydrolase [Pigmentiphaga sp.]MDX3905423.1 alpha/beta hydrolase [Pigmentiphaga sp.]